MSDRRFFSGNSIEQAVLKAAHHYQLEPGRLAYKVVEKKHGFIKQRRGVVIDVDASAPAKVEAESRTAATTPRSATPQVAATHLPAPDLPAPNPPTPSLPTPSPPAPSPPAPNPPTPSLPAPTPPEANGDAPTPAPQAPETAPAASLERLPEESGREDDEDDDDDIEIPPFNSSASEVADLPLAQGEAAEAAHHALATMLRLVGADVKTSIYQAEERLEIVIESEDTELFTQDEGEVLTAIQFLVPRIVRGITGQSTHCRVDAAGFHLERERRLHELAWRTAYRVDRSERSETLKPMPPDERRIVHLALADYDNVSTHSVGHGLYKRVAIRPD